MPATGRCGATGRARRHTRENSSGRSSRRGRDSSAAGDPRLLPLETARSFWSHRARSPPAGLHETRGEGQVDEGEQDPKEAEGTSFSSAAFGGKPPREEEEPEKKKSFDDSSAALRTLRQMVDSEKRRARARALVVCAEIFSP
ncbi:unnamed protein product [Ixodes persulcatus]